METRESEAVEPEAVSAPRPLSVDPALWEQVERQHAEMGSAGGGFLDEVMERSGFLILRGFAPEKALFEALSMMHSELDAMKANGRETLWWVVRAVAGVFPHPRRRPSGTYAKRILVVAEAVEENARADAGMGSAYARDDVPTTHLGPEGIASVEEITRRRCEQIRTDRTSVPDDEYLSDEEETGDYP